ncbi:UNVERIFIED_CONTAM: Vesicle-associated protein 1-3 [Sesamum latifolium]|uniref:Vesicle-associated protein 1-3 n=1 Tax=Sesamum latifolium TaxID=2727402 RepID=A0AAW2YFP3_9LAMI
MQLTNKTDQYVAFKVKTTNPKRYCVLPNAGVVLPNSVCNVTVTMQAQKEAPPDMQCRDKFLVQSVIAPEGAANKDVTPEMFNKEDGKVVDDFRLRVVFVPANRPSQYLKEMKKGLLLERLQLRMRLKNLHCLKLIGGIECLSFYDVTKFPCSFLDASSPTMKAWSVVSKLNEEKASIIKQNQKLLEELELIQKRSREGQRGGVSVVVAVVGLLLGILVGYLIRK